MRAHVQQRVEQMSQQDPEREAKALAGRVAELDKKLSRAQDLVTDGLISAQDLRENATAMRAERECVVRKLENLKDDRENIEVLKTRSKNALVACAFALHSGLRYFSARDYHGIYKRLGLKVRVAPTGRRESKAPSAPTRCRPTRDTPPGWLGW
jgi:hypothetical protein